jgi:hypothetical protein
VAALGQKGRAPAAAADESDLEHRIRKAEVIYTDVLASWISQRSQSETAEEKKLRDSLALIPDESPHSDQREIILSLLEERQGKSATALQHAIRAQALSSEEHRRDPRLLHWIASLSTKAGDIRAANRLYSELQVVKREKESRYESLGLPPVPELATLILAEGETLARRGKWGEAAAAYARAVEKGLGGNQLLFEYARALQKSPKKADQLRAQEVLTQITTSKQDDFWKKLAQEALENRQAKEGVK